MIAFITFVAFAILAVAVLAVLADCAIRGFRHSVWMRQQVRLYRALNSGVRPAERIASPVRVIDPASQQRQIDAFA